VGAEICDVEPEVMAPAAPTRRPMLDGLMPRSACVARNAATEAGIAGRAESCLTSQQARNASKSLR